MPAWTVISTDVYCHMFIIDRVSLELSHTRIGNSSKNSVHNHARCDSKAAWSAGLDLNATGSRENRQLMGNHLYFICNLTLYYADTLNQAVTGTRRPKSIWRV